MRRIIYFICCLCLIAGCKNSKQSDSLNENDKKEAKAEINFSTIIHPNLLKEIKEYTTGINSRRYKDLKVIVIIIGKFNNDYQITIFPNPYYLGGLDGYLVIDDKMIAFYYDHEKSVNGWVDTEKLIKTVPPEKYPDDKSDVVESGYDPTGKTFKVDNEKMTLELVHSGMLPRNN
ncbi:MAG: hypothetical protein LUH22_08425 [Bacteroides sp.]|nr:hypothetical protein [Bacteroides sp.]